MGIDNALKQAKLSTDKPTLISMKTIIGFGSPNKQGTNKIHGAPLGKRECEQTKKALQWDSKPFEIPNDLLLQWRKIGSKGRKHYQNWKTSVDQLSIEQKNSLTRRLNRELPLNFEANIKKEMDKIIQKPLNIATRKASQIALEVIT